MEQIIIVKKYIYILYMNRKYIKNKIGGIKIQFGNFPYVNTNKENNKISCFMIVYFT
jgi:hypothetical protein